MSSSRSWIASQILVWSLVASSARRVETAGEIECFHAWNTFQVDGRYRFAETTEAYDSGREKGQ
jgi:hypothetical protein